MCQSAQATVSKAEDATERAYALDRVPVPTPGETRFLHRADPARAHRRLSDYIAAYNAAMAADFAELRRIARDEQHFEELAEDYHATSVTRHGRASEAAWAEHGKLLERASTSQLRAVAEAHNSSPSWRSLWIVRSAAEVVAARPRTPRLIQARGALTRPRARRTAAARAAGPRSGQDPGEDGEPHRPPPRCGELRHVRHALIALLEDLRPGVAR